MVSHSYILITAVYKRGLSKYASALSARERVISAVGPCQISEIFAYFSNFYNRIGTTPPSPTPVYIHAVC